MKINVKYQIVTIFAILAVLGFSSCEKQEIVRVVGYVQGYVYDANDNLPLDNVTIKWEVAGGVFDSTICTASEGFSIRNLIPGTYMLECSKENYALSKYSVVIPEDDFSVSVKGGGTKEYIVSASPTLYSMNASVTGRVYKYDDILLSLSSPAENVLVKLTYIDGSIIPNVYETRTDEDGYYSFENVPAAYAEVLIADYKDEDDLNYLGDFDGYQLNASSATTVSNMYLIPLETILYDPLRLIGSNAFIAPNVSSTDFPVDSDIILEFSREISPETTQWLNDNVFPRVFEDQYSNLVPYTMSINGSIVTIHPDAPLTSDRIYLFRGLFAGLRVHDLAQGVVIFRTAP